MIMKAQQWLLSVLLDWVASHQQVEEQHHWFGFSSIVHSCLFLMCATDVHFIILFYI